MAKSESIDEFYQRKFDGAAFRGLPDSGQRAIGHFNVFRLEPYLVTPTKMTTQRRRDYFNVILVIGNCRLYYFDQQIEIQQQALVFCHPQVLYRFEQTSGIPTGYFFVFNQEFFYQYGNFTQYPVFQANGIHVFELTETHLTAVVNLYERMLEEINSDYLYKYDMLRNLVFEVAHLAIKMQPSAILAQWKGNANQRITTLFLDLLERQFPIDNPRQTINLRTASDFAETLHIHVNHLNRSVKEATQKTSTQLIAERLMQEAKILLKHSNWTVSEIAYALGFTEVTYFNSFFKKYTQQSPREFRHV